MTVEAAKPVADHLDIADMERRIKAIFIGSVGNLVEWYDFYAYTAFALYFAPAFFPNSDPVVQQLNAAVLFAATFLMRPLGGWLFGYIADRYGRRLSLTLSVVCMCFGSLIIAVTPTYASIGLAAPAILALARVIEGLSLGGEYGASATYLSEVADAKHRGFYSSFQYVTLISISPTSRRLHLRPVATCRDLSRQLSPQKIRTTCRDKRQRQPPTSRDLSRQVRTCRAMSQRLESEIEFLRGQMVVKDTQIKEMTERARETNVLIAGLQKMLTPCWEIQKSEGTSRKSIPISRTNSPQT